MYLFIFESDNVFSSLISRVRILNFSVFNKGIIIFEKLKGKALEFKVEKNIKRLQFLISNISEYLSQITFFIILLRSYSGYMDLL